MATKKTAPPALPDDRARLIADTVARGATPAELELFLAQCRRTGLDPFARQIYCVERRAQVDGQWVTRRETQVSIDGLRVIAERTGEVDGIEGPFWCGPDGVWKDVWLDKKPPVAARVLVFRKGRSRPFPGICRYDAYVQRKKDGTPTRFWELMPDAMLAKCAEALALRRAFPNDMSGLYTGDEAPGESVVEAEPAPPQKAAEPKRLPAPVGAPAASPLKGMPATGAECLARLQAKDADLAARGLAEAGALVGHVADAGARAGFSKDVKRWSGPALELAWNEGARYVRAAEEGLVWPAQQERLAAEIAAQEGLDAGELCEHLGVAGLGDIPRAKYGELLRSVQAGDAPGGGQDAA